MKAGLAEAVAIPPDFPNNARGLRERIEETFAKAHAKPARPARRLSTLARRGVKFVVGIVAAIGLGWSPLHALFIPTSLEAVVNARIVTVRAPTEGYLEAAPVIARQWGAAGETPALAIIDPDADRAPLAAATREVDDVAERIADVAAERVSIQAALDETEAQSRNFRSGRLAALDARVAGLSAEADAANERAAESDAQWQRARTLRASGTASAATEQHAQTEARASALNARSAAFKLNEAEVERDALAKGVFVGDSYNDAPNSAQAARELRLKLDLLAAQAASLTRAKARLDAEKSLDAAQFARRSRSPLLLPQAGRVWETLASPGERVVKGQEILRVVDCASAIVSADVQENVYNRLRIGGKASFTAADGTPAIVGEIVNLTGADAAPGVYAISPATLHKSPFYVSIALPQARADCAVGRTGTVTFSNN